jgi:hypothetical protein
MEHNTLSFSATNAFEIYVFGMGPTEFRIGVILLNTAIIVTGTNHCRVTLPLLCVVCSVPLIVVVRRTSATLWSLDMEAKRQAR